MHTGRKASTETLKGGSAVVDVSNFVETERRYFAIHPASARSFTETVRGSPEPLERLARAARSARVAIP